MFFFCLSAPPGESHLLSPHSLTAVTLHPCYMCVLVCVCVVCGVACREMLICVCIRHSFSSCIPVHYKLLIWAVFTTKRIQYDKLETVTSSWWIYFIFLISVPQKILQDCKYSILWLRTELCLIHAFRHFIVLWAVRQTVKIKWTRGLIHHIQRHSSITSVCWQ